MPRRRLLVVVALAVLAAFARPAAAATVQDSYGDPIGDGTVDIRLVVSSWDDAGGLGFGVAVNQNRLYAGEQVGLNIDVDGGAADVQMWIQRRLDGTTFMSMCRFMADGSCQYVQPATLEGQEGANGQVFILLNRSDLGYPDAIRFQAWSGKADGYATLVDWAPDGVWRGLSSPATVGGQTGGGGGTTGGGGGGGTDTGGGTGGGDMGGGDTTATRVISYTKATRTVRRFLRRRLPRGARIPSYLGCSLNDAVTAVRCKLTMRRKHRRWKGVATSRILASGRYRTRFRGVTFDARRPKRSRRAVRWG